MTTKSDYEKYLKFFNEFVHKYYSKNPDKQKKYDLKIEHTFKVIDLCEELAKNLKLNIYIAKTIGLFHDLGRFPQLYRYNTFKDFKSMDHAKKAVDILKKEKILEKDQEIILDSIFYHNKIVYDIPKKDDEKNKYIKMIRDADKIDIYRVIIDKKLIEKCDLPYNKKVLNSALKFEQVSNEIVNSNIDSLIQKAGWISEINFKESLKILKEKKEYLTLLNKLPEDNDLKKFKTKCLEILNKK